MIEKNKFKTIRCRSCNGVLETNDPSILESEMTYWPSLKDRKLAGENVCGQCFEDCLEECDDE